MGKESCSPKLIRPVFLSTLTLPWGLKPPLTFGWRAWELAELGGVHWLLIWNDNSKGLSLLTVHCLLMWTMRLRLLCVWGGGAASGRNTTHKSESVIWTIPIFNLMCYTTIEHFPGGASGQEPTCQCRRLKRHGFNSWIGKIPWRREWGPTPVFVPGQHHGQSLAGYSPRGRKQLDTTEAT